ncbi:methyltransferase domain-containing protein [Microcoleus vaginatus DQ-U2]|uniref:methyltransferase domain-containing protein n=1 Tax=Microcoleus vaginatus TaxID=119532 RepID=UPI00168436B7|nr:methyltransferase domain-containing protein [Microcoleus sp. FACHB-DQ6]
MSQPKSIEISKVTRYQNAALNYYLGLTDSPYLHYGYWETLPVPADELTIARLRLAQQAYTVKLLDAIPKGTHTILDVGCGIGGNAAYLLDRGFAVEGLAPDPFQQQRFLQCTGDRAIFHLTRFEDFKATHFYDLILFSESSQYMSAVDIANGAAKILNQGGYVLLADMLRSDANYKEGMFSNCHVVTELHAALKQAGFTLVKSEDISAHILPTIDLYVDTFRRYGLNTMIYVADLIAITVPPVHKFLRWIFRRWFKKLVVEGLEAGKLFEQHLCYEMQLWQLSKSDER